MNQSSNSEQVNQLLKTVLPMNTESAFQYLAQADADAEVINRVAALLKPSATRTNFLEQRGGADWLFASVAADEDLSGRTFANIKLKKKLGQGGMGAVYEGRDLILQRRVAVKALLLKHPVNEAAAERFRREALLLSKLDHENICRIHSLIEAQESDFLVLEYIEGEPLSPNQFKTYSQSKQLDIVAQILRGLQAAHRKNIIHRDIKPDNIMINHKGVVKLLDFGISRLTEASHISDDNQTTEDDNYSTRVGALIGTLNFMSPEQAAGEELSTATDMYSFGMLLQTLLSDVPPYPQNSTSEQLIKLSNQGKTLTPNDIPRHWQKLIQSLKAYAPADRPTAKAALAQVKSIQAKPKKRLRMVAFGVLILVAALATGKYISDLKYERTQAQLAQQKAEQVVAFLSGMFQQANPYGADGEELTAIDLLDSGAEKIDSELNNQLDARIYLKTIIADSYRLLNKMEQAKVLIEEAKLLADNPQVSLATKNKLMESDIEYDMESDNYKDAELNLKKLMNSEGISELKWIQLNNMLALLNSHLNKCLPAIQLVDESLAAIQHINDDLTAETIWALNVKGICNFKQGDYQQALDTFNLAVKAIDNSDEDHRSMKMSFINNMAVTYSAMGEHQKALDTAIAHNKLMEDYLPENHLDLSNSYRNIATASANLEDLESALKWNQKAIDLLEFHYQKGSLSQTQSMYVYAMTVLQKAIFLNKQEHYQEANDWYLDALEKFSEVFTDQHEMIADTYTEFAQNLWFQGVDKVQAKDRLDQAFLAYEELKQPLVRKHLQAHELKITMLKDTDKTAAHDYLKTILSELKEEGNREKDIKRIEEKFKDIL
ncbi:serine/threonine-protein kinase [Marinicella gelatinilytica]|uniref:serine/threonine-protein kinase n=1 Tax=Marinicella gelatinilytica TaxID=2996017 RepID=UPI002260A4FE|nr:serine/threonine-protein kinase [Marinicella gelatinilytica]MCX7545580.1 serine/threonine-protein kinase [Marinicella gelatinilytica]